jgi:hypothetical protein
MKLALGRRLEYRREPFEPARDAVARDESVLFGALRLIEQIDYDVLSRWFGLAVATKSPGSDERPGLLGRK